MPSYSDSYLDSFGEGIFTDSYGEGILGDSYGEGLFDSYGEATDKRRPIKVPPSVGRPSNFGGRIAPSPSPSGNFATKAELKSSLNSISDQVNDLKKSSLSIASSIKRLDDGYEKIVKGIARKSQSQDNVISSTPLMTMLGTIINKPTLNTSALTIEHKDGKYTVNATPDAIQVDLTKTFLFAMMPIMMSGSGSGGDNSMMMMMMMIMLVGIGGAGATGGSGLGSGSDSTLLIMMVMMMMMNKK